MLADNQNSQPHPSPLRDRRGGNSLGKKFLIALLVVAVFILGFRAGEGQLDLPAPLVNFVDRDREEAPREVDWSLLWDSIKLINEKYVNRPADMQKILYGAIQGVVGALDDPYSVFLPPEDAKDFREELNGSLEGIGAEIAVKHERLTVVAPLEGSPAMRAGIRGGDFIYKVDDEETQGWTIQQGVKKIRGPAGTKVKLTVLHLNDTEPVEVVVTREKIEVKSVESEIREVNGSKIGHMKVRRFSEDTAGLLKKAASDFLAGGVKGIVFDVRNNPGGFLDSAIEVASLWVKDGDIVLIQKSGDGLENIYRATGSARLNGISTIVLMNGGSASASEIVAGALKDHGLAKLIGEKSFGKGSVQELIELDGRSQLKLTIAKWLTPDGHDLNKEGLEPDIKVELKDEDFQNDRDPQLDRALEELTK